MTDFAIHLFGGYPLGVSVTRAYKWRKGLLQERVPKELDVCEAKRLLVKKLEAINTSSRNVQNYRFRKQILLVWAFTHRDATLLEQIYTEVPASLRANTVLITRCNGVDWINMPDRLSSLTEKMKEAALFWRLRLWCVLHLLFALWPALALVFECSVKTYSRVCCE